LVAAVALTGRLVFLVVLEAADAEEVLLVQELQVKEIMAVQALMVVHILVAVAEVPAVQLQVLKEM
jgi:hypothetical protein